MSTRTLSYAQAASLALEEAMAANPKVVAHSARTWAAAASSASTAPPTAGRWRPPSALTA